jgi:hypothetical protein
MKDTFVCQKCGTECDIVYDEGDVFCFCEKCNDYASGFNPEEYEEDLYSHMINQNYNDLLLEKLEHEI